VVREFNDNRPLNLSLMTRLDVPSGFRTRRVFNTRGGRAQGLFGMAELPVG
jgi:hypothetical protein